MKTTNKMERTNQTTYRFLVFRYILAILTEKGVQFPRVISLEEMQKEIPKLKQESLFKLMNVITKCCSWGNVIFDNEFNVMWQFKEPTLKELTITIWNLSSGDDCKDVKIEEN